MKILILMPNNISHVDFCMEIMDKLDIDVRQKCFSIPMYIQYLVETKKAPDQTEAFFYAMRAAEHVYANAKDKNENLILFGNINKDYKFDMIFNFQNNSFAAYQDLFIEALNQVIKPDGDDDEAYQILSRYTTNLHTADESSLILMNTTATAEFLNEYMTTDVESKLKQMEQEYLQKIEEINNQGKASMEAIKVLNNGRNN